MSLGTKYAFVSVSDKSEITALAQHLIEAGYTIISTGGTYKVISSYLKENAAASQDRLVTVESVTQFPEILSGRVKSLHPAIHGGVLANREVTAHMDELDLHKLPPIDVVVVNFYPFGQVVTPETDQSKAIELIDVGGVAVVRAAAKNYQSVTVLTDPSQYPQFMSNKSSTDEYRKSLAVEAFRATAVYDGQIAAYLSGGQVASRVYTKVDALKYGCNPHQAEAGVYSINGTTFPFELLNGNWGYINVLDAVGCWGLVRELSEVTGKISACSFKHTSPAGAAVAVEWQEIPATQQSLLSSLYNLNADSGPGVLSYVRARNADPQSSFGDFIGFSGTVDEELATLLKSQISDGIVAAGYTDEALSILKTKKKGNYVVIRADASLSPVSGLEFREICGFAVAQQANDRVLTATDFEESKIPTKEKLIPENAKLDLLVANTALKYAQSNSVSCAFNGQLVALAAGQQSRILCVRLVVRKAKQWLQRHSPQAQAILSMFKSKTRAQVKINATIGFVDFPDDFLEENKEIIENLEEAQKLVTSFKESPFDTSTQLSMASDAFFPFNDSIIIANSIGVKYITQAGGSIRDESIVSECDKNGIAMAFTGVRLFTH